MDTQDINYEWNLKNEKEDFSLDLNFYDEKQQEDKLWQARTGLNSETLCGAIETLIFMSEKPIPLNKIKAQIDEDLPLRVVHESLNRLQEEYEAKHHGIRLIEVAEGYQFRTKPAYSRFVQDLFKVNSLVLSPTSLEVLAIVAYKQPISKSDIEKIRGVESSHILRALMDKRLVRIVGRSEDLGRPSIYGTTPEFLEVFNLADISQLPSENELAELAETDSVGEINEIHSIVSGPKKNFEYDELGELDELSQSIRNVSADTSFIRTLKAEDKKRSEEGESFKSAFDILEEFIQKEEIVQQNKQAGASDILTTVMDAQVVSLDDLLAMEPINSIELEKDAAVDEAFAGIDQAVDDAFERLLEQAGQKLNENSKQAQETDKEFGIDLNFLQENKNNPSNEPDNELD